jgi:hypothetical protein
MAASNTALFAVGGVLIAAVVGTAVMTRGALTEIRSELASVKKDTQAAVSRIPSEVAGLVIGGTSSPVSGPASQDLTPRTASQVLQRIERVPQPLTSESVAALLGELDEWLVAPEAEQQFAQSTAQLRVALRLLVKAEVGTLIHSALQASSGAQGVKALTEARRVLARYPMSEDRSVIDEASQLTSDQARAAVQVENIRRLRYNRWAVDQVERAAKHFNENVSRWDPRNDNTSLIEPIIQSLGPIDPSLLEPVPLRLYEHVVERLKSALSEANRFSFAKALVDPKLQRRALGDF